MSTDTEHTYPPDKWRDLERPGVQIVRIAGFGAVAAWTAEGCDSNAALLNERNHWRTRAEVAEQRICETPVAELTALVEHAEHIRDGQRATIEWGALDVLRRWLDMLPKQEAKSE